ncbi:MAG: endonuclease/exonuclease/phosphatase family protein [Proteiniphilum sp.]|jgi:endonuclease/exonuclease/phosphatase family metal-dependent hydrolase|nr:endonuclease/exonuclease/phosphatase family protein [Proteiniphilum sp.]
MKKVIVWICLTVWPVVTLSAQNGGETLLGVATFNLRMDTPADGGNAWPHRKELVKGLIQSHDPDIVGTQEGFKHQLEGILELEDYACVGAGRDDGKEAGEHSAILYKKDRLVLLDSGDFWFSETPDVPGKGWDATCCNRICSWAKFEDKLSGKSFFVFNSHYDHEGEIARRNSSLLLLEKIGLIAGESPVFATGDFNATPDDEPIQIIRDSGKLCDSRLVTLEAPYGTEGTFNAFLPDSPAKSRIDYIWVTSHITIKRYGVLNDMPHGRFPSDHFPVMVQAKM